MSTIKDKIKKQDNEEIAYKFYLSRGWQPHQVSAIVGNLLSESNLSTTAIGDNGKATGIAQWHPDRYGILQKKYGNRSSELLNQLDFVDWELRNTHKAAGDTLKNTKGVWEAGKVVTDKFEAPKVKWNADKRRQKFVTDNYNKYSKSVMTEQDRKYFNKASFNEYGNQIQDVLNSFSNNTSNVTNNNIDFAVPEISSNLATVPDLQNNKNNDQDDEDAEVATAKDEIQNSQMAQNEEDFINELYANNEQQGQNYQQQIETGQELQKRVETPSTNLLEKYGQIEQFIDTAQQGGQVDMYGNPITAEIQYTDAPRTFYEQRLDKIVLGKDYKKMSPEQQEKTIAHENRHSWQQQNGRTNFNLTHNPDYAFNEKLKKQPSVVDTDSNWYKYHDRKSVEIGYDLLNLKQRNPNLQFVNNDILYDKVLDSQQYNNSHSLEGEAEYYQNTGGRSFQQGGEKNSLWKNIRANRGSGKKPTKQMLEQERKIKRNSQQGGENKITKDNNGYWNKANWGKPVEIQGGNITMKNVSQPLIGISDRGEVKYMMPEMEYFFKSAKNVTEYPV